STFKIEGKTKEGKSAIGTCFLVSKLEGTNWGWNVLVTADHVLSDIYLDETTLFLRKKLESVAYVSDPVNIKIREKGKALWVRHPEVDVAAMVLPLPAE